jgi:high affinity sulfate transporter 1
MQRWFPLGEWLPRYQWGSFLKADLIAAISVAALLIPESMGYSSVAGVPVQVGLYAAPLALFAYALFGGSKLLVVSAAGAVAAMSASVVGELAGGDQDVAVVLTAALAVATGAIFLGAGLAKLGWVTNFISKAVMAGFILGMGFQIIIGQLGKLVGVEQEGFNSFGKLWSVLSQIGEWDWMTVAVGFVSLFLIFGMERFVPKLPAALTAVVLASVFVAVVGPDIHLIAEIPRGLPSFALPTGIDLSTWGELFVGSIALVLIAVSESTGASAAVAEQTHDQLDSDQEFRALGLSNLGSGVLGGMSVAGSLSKTAAAASAGAKTQMANIILAGLVLLTLAFLAPAFQWLPEAVLAAVVINALWGAANPSKVTWMWGIDKVEFTIAAVTFLLVLSFDLLPAMIAGVVISVGFMVYRISFPGREVLGRLPDSGDFVTIGWIYGHRHGTAHLDAEPVPGVIVYRFAAPLFFANAEAFVESGQALLVAAGEAGNLPHTMVIDFEEVFLVDGNGAMAITNLFEYAKRYGIDIVFARVHENTHKIIETLGVIDMIGEDRIYPTVRSAVAAVTAGHASPTTE